MGTEGDGVINMKVWAVSTRPGQAGTRHQEQSSGLEQQTSLLHRLTFQTFSFCGRRWGDAAVGLMSLHTHTASSRQVSVFRLQFLFLEPLLDDTQVKRAASVHRFHTKQIFLDLILLRAAGVWRSQTDVKWHLMELYLHFLFVCGC